MKTDYYITQDGTLQRKENTVYFINENTRRALPVNRINTIYAYGHLSVTSGVLSFLSKEGVTVHFFGHYGHYEGSYYPKEALLSGEVLVRQVEHYLDAQKRLYLAKRFVEGAGGNILRNLRYYARSKPEVKKSVEKVAEELDKTLD